MNKTMTNKNKPYNQRDHSHCWEQYESACGLSSTHKKCCLCGLANKNKNWKVEFDKEFGEWLGKIYNIPVFNNKAETITDVLKSFISKHLNQAKEEEREKFESLLAEIIGDLYLKYKEGFCDYDNRTHKLGWFKEEIKSEIHHRLNK